MPTIHSECPLRVGLCFQGEMKEKLNKPVGGPRSPHHDNQSSMNQATMEEPAMAATEFEQTAPSTMDMEDQVEHSEDMSRDGEVEDVTTYAQQQSRYGRPLRPTTRMVKSREQARARQSSSVALNSPAQEMSKSLYMEPTELLRERTIRLHSLHKQAT